MSKRKIPLGIAVSAAMAVSACAEGPNATQLPDRIPLVDGSLEGTAWQLVEFQSMDDAQGTTRPANPDAYTMELGADGRVAFRLDCNRGMGDWSTTPAADGMSGTISFSRLAVTKAFCPPPSMGESLERDTQYMRGYLLRDGHLNISLMADGGIYVWEPIESED